jgi:hypothetical protein
VRSILASLTFWSVLLLVKHEPISRIISGLTPGDPIWGRWLFLAMFLLTDWLSLVKAKLILTFLSRTTIFLWTISFVIIDIICTLILLLVVSGLYNVILTAIFSSMHHVSFTLTGAWFAFIGQDRDLLRLIISFSNSENARDDVPQVAAISTLLTSAWVTLFLLSVLVVKLLAPLEYLRRFTIWWFEDIDAHPLRAIAKVAGTLIVIGALAFKAVRWEWMTM